MRGFFVFGILDFIFSRAYGESTKENGLMDTIRQTGRIISWLIAMLSVLAIILVEKWLEKRKETER